jgi:14-3-3 protein epsilon
MSVLYVMAKTACDAERYEDACHYMSLYIHELATKNQSLNTEERSIFDVAYKRVSASLRVVINTLNGILKDPVYSNVKSTFMAHKKEAQRRLSLVCNEILAILEETLIPAAETQNSLHPLICYRTMAGDYHRYLSGLIDESVQKAGVHYAQAYADAQGLTPTSVVRLGVANNYAVYCYEVLNDKEKACCLSKKASAEAAAEVHTLTDTDYTDCMVHMQILFANFKHWSTDTTTGKPRI